MTTSPGETLQFQAEVSRLLDIVANALYSQKEVFLRELISNSSDACDRLRYAALTQPELIKDDPDFRIRLTPDTASNVLAVEDNGLGMNREDLVENLGTIARSGTAAFLEKMGDQRGEVDLIGQFGVGFYSAFMVAETVVVLTRKAGEAQGWRWESDGKGSFTIAESDEAPARGTRILLNLREDAKPFLEAAELKRIVKTYSDHIAVPIELVEGDKTETLNSGGALWLRPKSDITEEQYKEFYHHTAHAFDEPWLRIHFRAEGMMEYTGLLFIPSMKPMDLFDPQRKGRVKLYVKRVFITDDCEELVPPYLRFLRGVVDSEDLPLNISRELLQHNPVLKRMKTAITKRVLSELENRSKEDAEGYAAFWENFGAVLKEGIYEDATQRDALLKLARFHSTHGDGLTSLDDYLARKKPGQEAIYTITGEDLESVKRSPQLEGFLDKGVEVLLLTDPVDEFWIPAVMKYEDLPFQSVTQGSADLDSLEGEEQDKEEDAAAEETPGLETLVAFVKSTLGDAVKDVKLSKRLTASPVCLVADAGDMDLHLARLLRQHNQLQDSLPRVLELNPKHSLILGLAEAVRARGAGEEAGRISGDALAEVAWLLVDQARILEGESPADPAAFSRRLTLVVEQGLGLPAPDGRTPGGDGGSPDGDVDRAAE